MSDAQFAIILLNIWGVAYSVAKQQVGWLGFMTFVWAILALNAVVAA